MHIIRIFSLAYVSSLSHLLALEIDEHLHALAAAMFALGPVTTTTKRIGVHARFSSLAHMEASLLQQDLDRVVESRALQESELLSPGEDLVAVPQRGAVTPMRNSGVGFGGKKGGVAKTQTSGNKSKKRKRTSPQRVSSRRSDLAKEMDEAGVVRINGVLTSETADALREFVDAERLQATAEVTAGTRKSEERFADLVLESNRCDLLLPLRGPVITALDELLGEGKVLGDLLEELVGPDASLNEVACLISEPGSKRQPIHPDTPYTAKPPLFAAFVALQDIDANMGPTIYLPGTHTKEEHTAFYSGDLERGRARQGGYNPIPEEYLAKKEVRTGLLKKGDVALYNQQVLHCGSANNGDCMRRQFYISVRDLSVKNVDARPSIRPAFRRKLTLGEVRDELRTLGGQTYRDGGIFGELDKIDAVTGGAGQAVIST